MRYLLVLVASVFVGCAPHAGPMTSTKPTEAAIVRGQAWPQAVATAQRTGYQTHDAASLEMSPTPSGFYLELPDGKALLVFCDRAHNTVEWIDVVEHWNVSKSARVYHPVDSFNLPPTNPAAR